MTEPDNEELPPEVKLLDEALAHAQELYQITAERYPEHSDKLLFALTVGSVYAAAALRAVTSAGQGNLVSEYAAMMKRAPHSLAASLADLMDYLPVEGDAAHMIARTLRRALTGAGCDLEEALARLMACVKLLQGTVPEENSERVWQRSCELAREAQSSGRVQVLHMHMNASDEAN